MAVLIEGTSVVLNIQASRVADLCEKMFTLIPNQTFASDGILAKISFMSDNEATDYANNLANLLALAGFENIYHALAIVSQSKGILNNTDWLKFEKREIEPGNNVSICSWHDDDYEEIAFPAGWKFEGSLSQTNTSYSATDFNSRHTYLRTEGNVDVYLDNETNKEVFISRVQDGA